MVLFIQILDGRDEAGGDTMLLVEINGTLNGVVSENITVGKVFGYNAGSWLLLLSDIVTVTLSILCEVASIILGAARGRRDLDFGGTKLGVVQEKGSLCCCLLFEGNGRTLSLPGWSDFEVSDLATADR